MSTLASLLEAPPLRSQLRPLCSPDDRAIVRNITLVEDIEELHDAPPESLVIMTRAASERLEPYVLDVALRIAGEQKVSAVVLNCASEVELSPTTQGIAGRGGISVIQTTGDVDLVALISAVLNEIEGGATASLQRAIRALPAIERGCQKLETEPEELVATVAFETGFPLEFREPSDTDLSAPVMVNGREEGHVSMPRDHAGNDAVARLLVNLTANAQAQQRAALRHAQEVPVRSRADLLTELLFSDAPRLATLLYRARAFGMPVDGWHMVVRFELDNVAEIVGDDDVAIYECTEQVARLALKTVRAARGLWYRAGAGTTLLLIRMEQSDPGIDADEEAAEAAKLVLIRVQEHLPKLTMWCGVSSVHSGPSGLRIAAAEAGGAAAEARAGGQVNMVFRLDPHRFRRTISQWYASEAAQKAVNNLLEPIDELGADRSAVLFETLQTYLDNQWSVSRTAKALHVHRNTVNYRIEQLFELLDVDAEDPDQLLLLHLACRARRLVGRSD